MRAMDFNPQRTPQKDLREKVNATLTSSSHSQGPKASLLRNKKESPYEFDPFSLDSDDDDADGEVCAISVSSSKHSRGEKVKARKPSRNNSARHLAVADFNPQETPHRDVRKMVKSELTASNRSLGIVASAKRVLKKTQDPSVPILIDFNPRQNFNTDSSRRQRSSSSTRTPQAARNSERSKRSKSVGKPLTSSSPMQSNSTSTRKSRANLTENNNTKSTRRRIPASQLTDLSNDADLSKIIGSQQPKGLPSDKSTVGGTSAAAYGGGDNNTKAADAIVKSKYAVKEAEMVLRAILGDKKENLTAPACFRMLQKHADAQIQIAKLKEQLEAVTIQEGGDVTSAKPKLEIGSKLGELEQTVRTQKNIFDTTIDIRETEIKILEEERDLLKSTVHQLEVKNLATSTMNRALTASNHERNERERKERARAQEEKSSSIRSCRSISTHASFGEAEDEAGHSQRSVQDRVGRLETTSSRYPREISTRGEPKEISEAFEASKSSGISYTSAYSQNEKVEHLTTALQKSRTAAWQSKERVIELEVEIGKLQDQKKEWIEQRQAQKVASAQDGGAVQVEVLKRRLQDKDAQLKDANTQLMAFESRIASTDVTAGKLKKSEAELQAVTQELAQAKMKIASLETQNSLDTEQQLKKAERDADIAREKVVLLENEVESMYKAENDMKAKLVALENEQVEASERHESEMLEADCKMQKNLRELSQAREQISSFESVLKEQNGMARGLEEKLEEAGSNSDEQLKSLQNAHDAHAANVIELRNKLCVAEEASRLREQKAAVSESRISELELALAEKKEMASDQDGLHHQSRELVEKLEAELLVATRQVEEHQNKLQENQRNTQEAEERLNQSLSTSNDKVKVLQTECNANASLVADLREELAAAKEVSEESKQEVELAKSQSSDLEIALANKNELLSKKIMQCQQSGRKIAELAVELAAAKDEMGKSKAELREQQSLVRELQNVSELQRSGDSQQLKDLENDYNEKVRVTTELESRLLDLEKTVKETEREAGVAKSRTADLEKVVTDKEALLSEQAQLCQQKGLEATELESELSKVMQELKHEKAARSQVEKIVKETEQEVAAARSRTADLEKAIADQEVLLSEQTQLCQQADMQSAEMESELSKVMQQLQESKREKESRSRVGTDERLTHLEETNAELLAKLEKQEVEHIATHKLLEEAVDDLQQNEEDLRHLSSVEKENISLRESLDKLESMEKELSNARLYGENRDKLIIGLKKERDDLSKAISNMELQLLSIAPTTLSSNPQGSADELDQLRVAEATRSSVSSESAREPQPSPSRLTEAEAELTRTRRQLTELETDCWHLQEELDQALQSLRASEEDLKIMQQKITSKPSSTRTSSGTLQEMEQNKDEKLKEAYEKITMLESYVMEETPLDDLHASGILSIEDDSMSCQVIELRAKLECAKQDREESMAQLRKKERAFQTEVKELKGQIMSMKLEIEDFREERLVNRAKLDEFAALVVAREEGDSCQDILLLKAEECASLRARNGRLEKEVGTSEARIAKLERDWESEKVCREEHERGMKKATDLSIQLAESQMKVDELTDKVNNKKNVNASDFYAPGRSSSAESFESIASRSSSTDSNFLDLSNHTVRKLFGGNGKERHKVASEDDAQLIQKLMKKIAVLEDVNSAYEMTISMMKDQGDDGDDFALG